MPCFKPLTAWRTDDGEITFKERGRIHSQLTLPCGQCRGCRLEKSRQWAMRAVHEAQMHRENSMLTLTYDDEHLPRRYLRGIDANGTPLWSGTLDKLAPSAFMHRLREHQRRRSQNAPSTKKPRFYLAGEYGEKYRRPHYHICLFGHAFLDDRIYLRRSPTGHKLWRSPTLEKLWPFGFSSIGELTFESAAYVARYIMKKQTGDLAKTHYQAIDLETGEILQLEPEFNNMSRRPGLGKSWLDKYTADVYPLGRVVLRGNKISNPPRFYDKKWAEKNPLMNEDLIYRRHIEGKKHWQDQTIERLKVREEVAAAQINQLKRKI